MPNTIESLPGNDHTELARRFRVVARAKNEWEAAIDAVTDLVFLTDRGGTVLRCNVAARASVGRPFDEIVGRDLEELLREGLGSSDCRLTAETTEIGSARHGSTFECSRFPVHRGTASLGWVVVLRDITELRQLQGMAARLDMMNNLGQVLSSVRHEIGNPVNAMKTALTVMAESVGDFSTEKLLSYIRRCLDDVSRIQALLEHLRTLNLFEISLQQRVDVCALLEAEIPAIREYLATQGILLTSSLPPKVPPAEATCDPKALYHILLGLIANSTEAISEIDRPGLVHLALCERAGFLELSVSDNGPGIPPDQIDKVILPLYTTKPKGTGLGLAIAHEMLTKMGGDLVIDRHPQLGGARLTVQVPVSVSAADARTPGRRL